MATSPQAPHGFGSDDPVRATSIDRHEWERIYPDLVRMARRRLSREFRAKTYDTHELAHDTYERLVHQQGPLTSSQHVVGTARILMERILIDRARRKIILGRRLAVLSEPDLVSVPADPMTETLDALERTLIAGALEKLRGIDERQARVVELRFLVGLRPNEIADMLGVTRRTVDRDWVHARCWLERELLDTSD
jgi:RNA polymerase sigma factor (TIGR02999 family)